MGPAVSPVRQYTAKPICFSCLFVEDRVVNIHRIIDNHKILLSEQRQEIKVCIYVFVSALMF